MSHHIVTTADERTWKCDRPVLFLGEWCRRYDRRHVWQEMDAVVAAPYGVGDGQKERDLAYVESVSTQLLSELAEALNRFHDTAHSRRYWHIVVGHWVRRYVAIVFNRFYTIQQALDNHDVGSTTVLRDASYSLATNSSLDSIWASNDDEWNHVLCARILASSAGIEVESLDVELAGPVGPSRGPAAAGTRASPREVANFILQKFRKPNDAVLAATYLPPVEAAKLQLRLGQCPQIWAEQRISHTPADRELRTTLRLAKSGSSFEQFLWSSASEALPTCYLEGYAQLADQAQVQFPPKPRFIFTSNRFDNDEVFKVWAASCAERGIPYFAGQHGNNYGTALGSSYWPELQAADTFFTWGWQDETLPTVPTFLFKTAGRRPGGYSKEGGLLLVELTVPHRLTPWDSYFEFGLYQEEQFRFVAALPRSVEKEVTVRLHAEHMNHSWSDRRRWEDRHATVHVDAGRAGIWKLLSGNRLVVHSYDSTGILEALAMNIPTICFWHGGFTHVMPRVRKYYDLLREVGIFHPTPEAAAKHVARHWDTIEGWWKREEVQEARVAFCEQFARSVRRPSATLARALSGACIALSNSRSVKVPSSL